jgi:hypothetical protein
MRQPNEGKRSVKLTPAQQLPLPGKPGVRLWLSVLGAYDLRNRSRQPALPGIRDDEANYAQSDRDRGRRYGAKSCV